MKTLFLCILLLLGRADASTGTREGCFVPADAPRDTLRVLFWNLENFFDWRNEGRSDSDAEFSSQGARHWTRKRFYIKCNAIAKAILWIGSSEDLSEEENSGGQEEGRCPPEFPSSETQKNARGLPDVIGLAEVENAYVLRRLLDQTLLRKLDYRIVHFDSPDRRGIDVALLYRSSRLEMLDARPCHLYAADTVMATRDILLARFRTVGGRDVAYLVNHHPSKYGGVEVSEPRRRMAVERLKALTDSLNNLGIKHIVAMGDMNDTPGNPVYKLLEPGLRNLAEGPFQKGEGTIKYDGVWQLIDMIFVSPAVEASAQQILQIPFLMTRDAGHAGEKPLRTYSGPRYLGGVSDHCPVWTKLVL